MPFQHHAERKANMGMYDQDAFPQDSPMNFDNQPSAQIFVKPSKPSKSEFDSKQPEKDPMVWDPPTPKINNEAKAKKSNWGNKP